jgi:hypothetical protein
VKQALIVCLTERRIGVLDAVLGVGVGWVGGGEGEDRPEQGARPHPGPGGAALEPQGGQGP